MKMKIEQYNVSYKRSSKNIYAGNKTLCDGNFKLTKIVI